MWQEVAQTKKSREMVAKMWKDSRGSRTLQKSERKSESRDGFWICRLVQKKHWSCLFIFTHVDLCHSAGSMYQNHDLNMFRTLNYYMDSWWFNMIHVEFLNLIGHLCLAKWFRINFIYSWSTIYYLTELFNSKNMHQIYMSCTVLSLKKTKLEKTYPL